MVGWVDQTGFWVSIDMSVLVELFYVEYNANTFAKWSYFRGIRQQSVALNSLSHYHFARH